MNMRIQLKNKLNQVNDPVLQRDDRFVFLFNIKFRNQTKPNI